MFAVPGWSLSADLLKTQQEAPKKSSKSSKKRKRTHGQAVETQVCNEGLPNLRETQVVRANPKESRSGKREEESRIVCRDPKSKTMSKSNLKQAKPEILQSREALYARAKTSDKLSKKRRNNKSFTDNDLAAGTIPEPLREDRLIKHEAPYEAHLKLTPLQQAMRQKLVGAHFRHLNESLYSTSSAEAQRMFDSNPRFFDEYHSGFRQQVSTWPENPVEGYVQDLRKRADAHHQHQGSKGNTSIRKPSRSDNYLKNVKPLPRTGRKCTVADLGCGDAFLATQVLSFNSRANIEVLSYDLCATNPLIKKADIAKLPLESGSVNVAILCLALMGTNWIESVEEAYRILQWNGELWVAEIKSRFMNPGQYRSKAANKERLDKVEKQKARQRQEDDTEKQIIAQLDGSNERKDTTDVSAFLQVIKRRGFVLENEDSVDLRNTMFAKMSFVKALPATTGKHASKESAMAPRFSGKAWNTQFDQDDMDNNTEAKVLKPCVYKTR